MKRRGDSWSSQLHHAVLVQKINLPTNRRAECCRHSCDEVVDSSYGKLGVRLLYMNQLDANSEVFASR